jgi:hypothetical protein
MKRYGAYAELVFLLICAGVLIGFSAQARKGAAEGLALAENTVIPSLLPVLIIFLLIMKTGARDALAGLCGGLVRALFALPYAAAPAIILGLTGGYPTGALLTRELYLSGEISREQARRIMLFNMSGGCGFIITAVGSAVLKSTRAGALLFAAVTLSSVVIGIIASFPHRREDNGLFSYRTDKTLADSLNSATASAVNSVLTITAYIVAFSAFCGIVRLPDFLIPLLEITNGVCLNPSLPLPLMSAYLAFGGICIHLQLVGTLRETGSGYASFLAGRAAAAVLSYIFTKALLILFPVEAAVFANSAVPSRFSSVNAGLSGLLIIGCFVMVLDINSKRKAI